MGSALSSFNRSGLGAFRRSGLGARGGISIGARFYQLSTGAFPLYKSADGINFATAGINHTPVTVSGTRLFLATAYSDSPYTSATAYSGLTGSLAQNILIAGSALVATRVSGGNRRVIRSTNGGATWADITHPASSSGGSFVQVCSPIIKTLTGRLLTIGRSSAAGNLFYPIYSDDDGATWTGGATGAFSPSTTATFILFDRSDGSIVLCRGDAGGGGGRTYDSADDGATFTLNLTGVPNGFVLNNAATVMCGYLAKSGTDILYFNPKGGAAELVVIRNEGVSAGDYSFVTTRGIGFLGPDNVVYSVRSTDDKLYSSPISDLSTWTLVVTSPTTLTLAGSVNRLVAINQLG